MQGQYIHIVQENGLKMWNFKVHNFLIFQLTGTKVMWNFLRLSSEMLNRLGVPLNNQWIPKQCHFETTDFQARKGLLNSTKSQW